MDLISNVLEGLPAQAYAKRVAAVRSKDRRYCEHPECQARQIDGKGSKLAWDNTNPYCGACLRRVGEEDPSFAVPDARVCPNGHSLNKVGTTRGGGCAQCGRTRGRKYGTEKLFGLRAYRQKANLNSWQKVVHLIRDVDPLTDITSNHLKNWGAVREDTNRYAVPKDDAELLAKAFSRALGRKVTVQNLKGYS